MTHSFILTILCSISSALFAMVGSADTCPHMQTKFFLPWWKRIGDNVMLVAENEYEEGISTLTETEVIKIEGVTCRTAVKPCEVKL